MTLKRMLLVLGALSLAVLLLLGCFVQLPPPTPVVITREVTRVVTPVPTPTPIIVERIITVTMVVTMPSPKTATPIGILSPSVTAGPAKTGLPTLSPTAEMSLPSEYDPEDPGQRLAAFSQAATKMQGQGCHTLRLTLDLSVPLEVTVDTPPVVRSLAAHAIQTALASHSITGDYILDISVDDLAQGKWVINGLGGISGLGNEETVESLQNGEMTWTRSAGGAWAVRKLVDGEAILPLGNAMAPVDDRGNLINVTDLVTDAFRPLLLLLLEEQSPATAGWQTVAGESGSSQDWTEMQRNRVLSSSANLRAITVSLFEEALQVPELTIGRQDIQETTCSERASLDPVTHLVHQGRVQIQDRGTMQLSYRKVGGQLLFGITLATDNAFECLSSATVVTVPQP